MAIFDSSVWPKSNLGSFAVVSIKVIHHDVTGSDRDNHWFRSNFKARIILRQVDENFSGFKVEG